MGKLYGQDIYVKKGLRDDYCIEFLKSKKGEFISEIPQEITESIRQQAQSEMREDLFSWIEDSIELREPGGEVINKSDLINYLNNTK